MFEYTVAPGEASPDLDYQNSSALVGTLADAAGNAAMLALPAPGAAGSLSAQKAIVIDSVSAVVLDVTALAQDGTYGKGAILDITVQFSEAVSISGTPRNER